jgi:flavin-dependent thymidylate synthase
MTPDIASMIGFSIGDGYLSKSGRIVSFHLRRERKILWLQNLVDRLDWTMDTKGDNYKVHIPEFYRSLMSDIYNTEREKQLPYGFLTSYSTKILNGLLLGLLESDGHRGKTTDCYGTTSKTLAGQFQQLCLHLGVAANLKVDVVRKQSLGKRPFYSLHIIRRSVKPEINRYVGMAGRSEWIEGWSGTVYCAEVPNNTLYVRRNGIPVWCGNSVFEHATWTWAIEGCSRVFTGEMNRHRAGVAISEGSMRYIRFDNIAYWLPLSIAPVEGLDEEEQLRRHETRLLFECVFKNVEWAYRELEELWDIDNMKDFKRKKQLTSMFRRIVPMGVATGGLWTFNGRALRHIMALRTTPEAEEEIAYVVGMIAKHMVETECRLFGDFEQRDGCWVPKYPKV